MTRYFLEILKTEHFRRHTSLAIEGVVRLIMSLYDSLT